jgi:nucleoside-diphosphate-sugar epimerase
VALLEPGKGPRRYMLGGRRVSVGELAELIGEAADRDLAVVPVPDVALRTVGRIFDVIGDQLPFETPINSAAMQYYTQMPPSDDAPAQRDLGIVQRPVADTIADTVEGLREVGRL